MDQQDILAIATLFRQGMIGEANSRYAQLLTRILSAVDDFDPVRKRNALRTLSGLSRQQKQEDWVGMADRLEHELAVIHVE